jgi:transcriptional regulator with XRE-family HTH domain
MNPSERLEAARVTRGLSREDVATRLGLSKEFYWDLEHYPEELLGNISLAHLQILSGIIRISPLELITGSTDLAEEPVGFGDVIELLRRYRSSTGVSVDELSNEVGWELKDALIDENELWNFCVDGLKDVCDRLDLDWRRALPDLPPSST